MAAQSRKTASSLNGRSGEHVASAADREKGFGVSLSTPKQEGRSATSPTPKRLDNARESATKSNTVGGLSGKPGGPAPPPVVKATGKDEDSCFCLLTPIAFWFQRI